MAAFIKNPMSVHETPKRVTSTVNLKSRLGGGLAGVEVHLNLAGGAWPPSQG